MTRKDLLTYIKDTHGKALKKVSVPITDTPETLLYVLFDALNGSTDEEQKAIADREVARLITDKTAQSTPEEVTNVSHE